MFQESGLSIAMGNAVLEVQQTTTHVTASCDDEGFAADIEQFVIPPA
jgi:hydroxymethylpyrimidine pyrophosphatase-like HAD family hydrolase